MEPVAVRRARITLRLREAELREAEVEHERRQFAAEGTFAPEGIELSRLAAEQALASRDLAALDLEEASAVEGRTGKGGGS